MCIKLAKRKFFHETVGSATVKKTQTFPGPEQPISEPGPSVCRKFKTSERYEELESSLASKIRRQQGKQSRKIIPQFEQTISELGNLLLCTGLSESRFFQEAAENAMQIALAYGGTSANS